MNTAATYNTVLKLGRDEHLCTSGNTGRDIIPPVEMQQAHAYIDPAASYWLVSIISPHKPYVIMIQVGNV